MRCSLLAMASLVSLACARSHSARAIEATVDVGSILKTVDGAVTLVAAKLETVVGLADHLVDAVVAKKLEPLLAELVVVVQDDLLAPLKTIHSRKRAVSTQAVPELATAVLQKVATVLNDVEVAVRRRHTFSADLRRRLSFPSLARCSRPPTSSSTCVRPPVAPLTRQPALSSALGLLNQLVGGLSDTLDDTVRAAL